MIARLRQVLRRARGDEGITLVEALVTMGVSSILLVAVSAMVISGVRTADAANKRTEATSQMRLAADQLTKVLRTADSFDGSTQAIITAEGERIGFYAKLNTIDLGAANAGSATQIPSVIWIWSRDAADGRTREVCQQVYRGTVSGATFTFPTGAASPTGTRTCKVIARGLSRTPAHPLFTYLKTADTTYGSDGASVSSIAVDASGNVAAANVPTIQSVEVWMTSKVATSTPTKDHSAVARVTFINLTARR